MGVTVEIRDEFQHPIRAVRDPNTLLPWLIALAGAQSSSYLRFIDLHGATMFNSFQIPELRKELDALSSGLTEPLFELVKRDFVQRYNRQFQSSLEEATFRASLISLSDIREYLASVTAVVNEAQSEGPNLYIWFIGQ